MNSIFPILMVVALAAVLASLFIGLFAMSKGEEKGAKLSQKMMRWRVVLQASALAIFAVAMLVGR